jgi:hypothetical protein
MSSPTSSSPTHKEEIAALATVQKFISGIKVRNPAQMQACIHASGGHALLIRPSLSRSSPSSLVGKQHISLTLAEVVNRIPFDGPERLEENIARAEWEEGGDGEVFEGRKSEVRVDGDLAVAWTPYAFLRDGVLSHIGMNVLSLVKLCQGERKGEWVIGWISDTWRMPGEEVV